MHHRAVGLVFKEPSQAVAAQRLFQLIQTHLHCRCSLFQFPAAAGEKPFCPVKAPDLKRRIETKQGRNLLGGPSGDYDKPGTALALDSRQKFPYAAPWVRLKPVYAERRQRAVVIKE